MKENYESLEFDVIKKTVALNCSFSLGKEYIENEDVCFNYLEVKRNIQRGKEALRLYEAYQNPSFAGVKDIAASLRHIEKGGSVSLQELYEIALFSKAAFTFKKYMEASEVEAFAIVDLVDSLSLHKEVIREVERCISASYEVMDQASSMLREIRRSISLCEKDITKTTQDMIARYSAILMENITAIRNGRTCLLVKISDKYKIKGFIHGESASGQAVYIEPEALLQLNNRLHDLYIKEKEEIERIVLELCALIKPYVHEYLSDLDTFALLDVLFAKAKWAYDHLGVYADIEEHEPILYFRNARHPLIDEKKVVANTYHLEKPHRHLLITGSNTGGKTVTLKTLGLFTIMTLAGFPILCEEARVYCFDGVYVDIGDKQSIVESLSTFSAHISKLASICKKANDRSLVLLDELGSGTDPNEGECLAIAVLDYFREHHIMCVATTHYAKLKEYAKNSEDVLMASVAFDMEKMCPTYRYLEGYAGTSNALAIASRYGLKDSIITCANALKEKGKSDSLRLLERLDKERMELDRLKQELILNKEALNKEKAALDKERVALVEEREVLLQKAKKQSNAMIEEARKEADEVIAELKAMKPDVKHHEITAVRSRLNQETEIQEEIQAPVEYAIGDYVRLKKLGYHGEIESIKGNRATVFANGMKMNVKMNELELTPRPHKPKIAAHSSKVSKKKVSMECNLIGMRVSEAIPVMDKYLDNAMFSRIYQVRIIHGAGTGALRKGVHEYLKKHKYVDTYRLGNENEGGLGATVVTLKHKDKKHG